MKYSRCPRQFFYTEFTEDAEFSEEIFSTNSELKSGVAAINRLDVFAVPEATSRVSMLIGLVGLGPLLSKDDPVAAFAPDWTTRHRVPNTAGVVAAWPGGSDRTTSGAMPAVPPGAFPSYATGAPNHTGNDR